MIIAVNIYITKHKIMYVPKYYYVLRYIENALFKINLKSDVGRNDIGDSTTGDDTGPEFFLRFSKTSTRTTIDSMDLKTKQKNYIELY